VLFSFRLFSLLLLRPFPGIGDAVHMRAAKNAAAIFGVGSVGRWIYRVNILCRYVSSNVRQGLREHYYTALHKMWV
jgi:hypothetical protein